MNPKTFALVAGILSLTMGIVGFLPWVVEPPHEGDPQMVVDSGYGYLLGLFPINILYNMVHFLVGVLGIDAGRALKTARNFARGIVIFYGLLALMGLIPGLNTAFGVMPLFGHNVWLHAGTAFIAAYVSWSAGNSPVAMRDSSS
jgi:hypothetical protein